MFYQSNDEFQIKIMFERNIVFERNIAWIFVRGCHGLIIRHEKLVIMRCLKGAK